MDNLVYALDSITWYNGLAPIIYSWMYLEKGNGGTIMPPKRYGAPCSLSDEDVGQLQIFWMLAVELFGECGTSPRFGWIIDVVGFRKWILAITETWRNSDEFCYMKNGGYHNDNN